MPASTLLLEKHPSGYAVVTLNRPEAMNALSMQLRNELADTIDALSRDEAVRVLILTGAGKAFCAGLDLKEIGSGAISFSSAVEKRDPIRSLARFEGPVIGAINGSAVTGGFEIALACDVLIASTAARFADTHVRVGVMPGWGLSQRLSRAIGIARAKELSLTGNFLSAEQAADWGLVNRVVSPDQLMPQVRKLAEDMLSVIPEMLVAYKKLIDDGHALSFGEAMQLESQRSKAANPSVRAEDVEARRREIVARGRKASSE
jgi:enoyl-CoA hydratase